MNGISTTKGIQHRVVRVRRSYREGVAAAAKRDVEPFDRSVGDAGRHTQTSQSCAGQITRVATGVRCVINVHRVAASFAVDRQWSADRVHAAVDIWCLTANVDRVSIITCVDRHCGANRLDIRCVSSSAGVHSRVAGSSLNVNGISTTKCIQHRVVRMGRGDRECISAAAKRDI